MTARLSRKHAGAYYTPDAVASTLLKWGIRSEDDRFLDPSCGDGRFLAKHRNSVGIEQDPIATHEAIQRAPWALVHEGDFFTWAAETTERFDVVGGNPPFIRYQTFKGTVRERARALCHRLGADFTGLSSSWAPFIVASAGLLNPGGRLAFVVPAEIGHAPYAAPLLDYILDHFETVHVTAYRTKLFPELSEDCWLLFADGFGGSTTEIRFSARAAFEPLPTPPRQYIAVSRAEWREHWNRRLRPYLVSQNAREAYRAAVAAPGSQRLRDLARVGIGYVSGGNSFFHLRPSEAEQWAIPDRFLRPTVRKGEALPEMRLTASTVRRWKKADEEVLLLHIPKDVTELPRAVRRYLDSDAGLATREGYKCRNRSPWYSVPDVRVPDFFLSYMAGLQPSLVRNEAGCTCTNSLHAVQLRSPQAAKKLHGAWQSDLVRLSCELEGHPLGGGMLKLEPGEAANILVPASPTAETLESATIVDAVRTMREWRHYA